MRKCRIQPAHNLHEQSLALQSSEVQTGCVAGSSAQKDLGAQHPYEHFEALQIVVSQMHTMVLRAASMQDSASLWLDEQGCLAEEPAQCLAQAYQLCGKMLVPSEMRACASTAIESNVTVDVHLKEILLKAALASAEDLGAVDKPWHRVYMWSCYASPWLAVLDFMRLCVQSKGCSGAQTAQITEIEEHHYALSKILNEWWIKAYKKLIKSICQKKSETNAFLDLSVLFSRMPRTLFNPPPATWAGMEKHEDAAIFADFPHSPASQVMLGRMRDLIVFHQVQADALSEDHQIRLIWVMEQWLQCLVGYFHWRACTMPQLVNDAQTPGGPVMKLQPFESALGFSEAASRVVLHIADWLLRRDIATPDDVGVPLQTILDWFDLQDAKVILSDKCSMHPVRLFMPMMLGLDHLKEMLQSSLEWDGLTQSLCKAKLGAPGAGLRSDLMVMRYWFVHIGALSEALYWKVDHGAYCASQAPILYQFNMPRTRLALDLGDYVDAALSQHQFVLWLRMQPKMYLCLVRSQHAWSSLKALWLNSIHASAADSFMVTLGEPGQAASPSFICTYAERSRPIRLHSDEVQGEAFLALSGDRTAWRVLAFWPKTLMPGLLNMLTMKRQIMCDVDAFDGGLMEQVQFVERMAERNIHQVLSDRFAWYLTFSGLAKINDLLVRYQLGFQEMVCDMLSYAASQKFLYVGIAVDYYLHCAQSGLTELLHRFQAVFEAYWWHRLQGESQSVPPLWVYKQFLSMWDQTKPKGHGSEVQVVGGKGGLLRLVNIYQSLFEVQKTTLAVAVDAATYKSAHTKWRTRLANRVGQFPKHELSVEGSLAWVLMRTYRCFEAWERIFVQKCRRDHGQSSSSELQVEDGGLRSDEGQAHPEMVSLKQLGISHIAYHGFFVRPQQACGDRSAFSAPGVVSSLK